MGAKSDTEVICYKLTLNENPYYPILQYSTQGQFREPRRERDMFILRLQNIFFTCNISMKSWLVSITVESEARFTFHKIINTGKK